NDVFDAHWVRHADSENLPRRVVEPDIAPLQITRPESQLTGTGGKFHQLLAFAQLLLRSPAPAALHDQSEDGYALHRDNCQDDDDPVSVLAPDGRLTKLDCAPSRQSAFADVPALQFSPV